MKRNNSISKLSEQEIKILFESVKAAAYDPFFYDSSAKDDPYWEVHSLFGLSINDLKDIADNWPNVDFDAEDVILAINNSINNLLGYPHNCSEQTWSKYISVSEKELFKILIKWRGNNPKNYFEAMM